MKTTKLIIVLLLFPLAKIFAQDSLYTFSKLCFSLRSANGGLTLQKNFPRQSPSIKDATEYDYCEGDEKNENYFAEIRIYDCREKLKLNAEPEKEKFFRNYIHDVYTHHEEPSDTTSTFRNGPCIIGHGNYVSGALHGNKKQVYKFIVFFYKDIIFEVTISDTKKNLEKTYAEFFTRFELI
jgi:hypothetical protein